jgi:FkbM family methyltransferase
LNNCAGIQPVRVALSDHTGTLTLQSDAGFGDAYRYLRPPATTDSNGNAAGEIVDVVPLDVYAANHGIKQVDYMKVDVEGNEFRVFAGSRQLLAASPNLVVMFESEPDWCARAGCRQQDTFELFSKLGFGLFAWDSRQRKWLDDEASVFSSSTVWASRDRGALPAL